MKNATAIARAMTDEQLARKDAELRKVVPDAQALQSAVRREIKRRLRRAKAAAKATAA